jgi:outer membrane protein OmpA-like peptidoglycan-associated protein
VFQDLKAGRSAALTFYDAYKGQGNDSTKMVLRGFRHGTLTRVEPGDVPYSIIVNEEHKELPTIHAKGDPYEAWVLDDEANPLVLKMVNPKTGWNVTYVKITFPVEKKIEQDLAQNGRAEIYGIYFDFDSATLRPESGPVLKEIAEALQHNPGWKIKIDGHTDNIGGSEYNLQLSQRRAGAVKQALIAQYGIPPDRMMPEGFGASRPKAPNDTVEGRALNRRVELVRE